MMPNSLSKFQIKQMLPDEVNLEEVVFVTQAAFGELVKEGIQTPTASITIEELHKRCHTHYWCAYVDNTLIGFINGNFRKNRIFYVDIVAVLPSYVNIGIGSQLMRTMEQYLLAQGINYIYLNTMLPAKENVQWYKNMQYWPYEIKNYTGKYYSIVFRKYAHPNIFLKINVYLHFLWSYIYICMLYEKPDTLTNLGKIGKYIQHVFRRKK